MTIDVHTHIGCSLDQFPEEWGVTARSKTWRNQVTKGRPWKRDLADFDPRLHPGTWDLSDAEGEVSYQRAESLGIDKIVLLPIDFHLIGEGRFRRKPGSFQPKMTIEEVNKHTADVAAKHPDKYIPFASIDPRRGAKGLELVKRAVQEWGMKGLKLHPTAGYFPHDRELCYPLYELCLELDIPILTHCGPESAYCPSRYGDPTYWEDVLSDFPELRVCLAHAGGAMAHLPGRQLMDPLITILITYENAFTDLASGQVVYLREPENFYKELRRLLDMAAGKVMWGTDIPWMESRGMTWQAYLDVFQNPDPEVLERAGVSLSKEEVDGILGENAKHFLKF